MFKIQLIIFREINFSTKTNLGSVFGDRGMYILIILKSVAMKIKLQSSSLLIALIAGASFVLVSCDKDDDDDNTPDVTYTISGNASGAQEVPAVTTGSTGTLTGTYNANTNVLQYNINWTGLSDVATMAHFHGPALAGENADPIIDLNITTNGTAGNITGTSTLHDTTENHLLNGRLYYNVHTALNPAGEIRGQVTAVEQ
jgi:hypothetical protein